MNKRFLPPFGKSLLHQRERGEHPDRVWVIYGNDCWRRKPDDAPVLCVPGDYLPGRYDWSLVAGVPVDIVYRDGEFIHVLAAEVALFAAPTRIHWRDAGWAYCEHVDDFLILDRRRPEVAPRWTPDIEADYREREHTWCATTADRLLNRDERPRQTA